MDDWRNPRYLDVILRHMQVSTTISDQGLDTGSGTDESLPGKQGALFFCRKIRTVPRRVLFV
jgi:hypothetical protein